MSFWDKIEEGGKWIEQTGAPAVGGAFSAANHFVTDLPVVGGFVGGFEHMAGDGLSTLGEVDAWTYNHVINYPLSTALQVGADWDTMKHAVAHPGDFVTAWNKTMDIPGKQHGISWGRALMLDYNHTGLPLGVDALWGHDLSNDPATAGFSMTAEAQAKREKYVEENWQAKFASGAVDLFGTVALDPLVIAGKFGKAGVIADKSFKDADQLNRVMDAASGAEKAENLSKKEVNLTNTVVDIVTKHTEEKDASAISRLPWFRRSANGGVYAGLFADANVKFAADPAARFQAKQTILGAMLDHKPSIDALRAQQVDLAAEVDALLKPPPTASYGAFTFDDMGKAVWEGANAEAIPNHVLDKAEAIEQQAGRLAQVVGPKQGRGAGLADLRGGGLSNSIAYKFRQSHIATGYAAKPIRIIAAVTSNRLPGYASTVDTQAGFQDLKSYLTKAAYLASYGEKIGRPRLRDELLNTYMAAGTKEARARALEDAVEKVNASIAHEHGVKPLTANALLNMGKKTSDNIKAIIRTRMYSADPKANTVMVHNPFEGEYVAIPRPIAQTQLEDAVLMPDPIQLAKVYKAYAGNRILDHIPKIGTPAADLLYGPIKDGAEMFAHAYTAVWRFFTLFNLGYPLRVLSDAVLRANIYMGPIQYLNQTLLHMVPAVAKAGFNDKTAITDMLKGNTQKVLTQYWKDMGFSDEEIPYILENVGAKGGSLADVASETGDRLHGKVAGTGQWSAKHPGEDGYNADFIRAVNQIRESPTLMAAVRGLDGDMLKNFVYSNAPARREWMEMRHANENDIDAWLARVEAHVNSVLPTNESRAWVSGNDVLDAAEDVAGFKPKRLPPKRKKVDNPNKPGKKMLVPNPEYDRIVQENAKNAQERIATLMESDGYKGRAINDDLIQKWFPRGDGPIIHGENFNPAKADTVVNRTMTRLGKFRDSYYRFASEGPDNILARAPQYRYVFFRELKRIKNTLGKDATLEDMNLARRTADQIARREVGRTAFNSSNTSRLASSFRYVAPFYSAWEDTMKRYALLFYQKPWAPFRIGNIWDAPNRNGMLHDDYGNTIIDGQFYEAKTGRKLDPNKDLVGDRRLVTLPVKWLPQKFRDGLSAVGVTGEDLNVDSINSVFQGDPWWLPGTGPLVQVPMNELIRSAWPEAEDNPIIRWILPFGTNDKSMWDISPDGPWVPTKYQHLKDAFGDGKDFQETLKNIVAYDTEKYLQGKGPKPNIEEESSKARNFLILKAGLNWASPVRLEPDQDGQFYIDQAKIYRNKFIQDPKVLDQYIGKYGHDAGLMKFKQDYPSWEEKFYQDFPQYFLMGSSLSANESGVVATIKAANETDKYMGFIKQNREWGWLVAGPANQYGESADTKFSQAALNQERADGLRSGHDASDAVAAMARSQGWIQYQAAATKVNLLYEKLGITKSDPAARPYQQLLSAYARKLGERNTAFADDFNSMNTEKSLMALSKSFDLMDTYKNTKNDVRSRPDMRAIAEYAAARNKVIMVLAQRPAHSLTAKSNRDIAELWDRYTQTLVKNNIGFEQLYNRILVHDKLDILFDPSATGGMGRQLGLGAQDEQPDGQ